MSLALTRTLRSSVGLLLTILALVSQLALGSVVLADDASAAELDAIAILCQTPVPGAPVPAVPHHQHLPDCAICPLCVALALPGAILTPAPLLPAPSVRSVAQVALPPPARAPPDRPLRIAQPRGPPALT